MTTEQFKDLCNRNGYSFEEQNDRLIVTAPYNFTLGNYKKLPKNLTFKNKGYVNLPNVEEISESAIFENIGDVYMKQGVIIPEGFKGFKNKGNIMPENFKLKQPILKFQFSTEIDNFLSDYHNNKYAKKLRDLNFQYINEGEQITMIDFSGVDDVAFLPCRNIIKLYKKVITEEPELAEQGIERWIQRNRTTLFKEAKKNAVKVGRFLAKLFPEITDVEKEEFATIYKSYKSNNEYEFELLKGDDIITAYYTGNQDTKTDTVLFNSCMNWTKDTDEHPFNHRNKKKMLEFYSKNPNCEILVLRLKNAEFGSENKTIVVEQDPNNPIKLKKDGTPDKRYKNHTNAVVKEEISHSNFRKIRGRALVWHDTKNKVDYMEMVYTTKPTETVMFENYAKENGWVTSNNKYEDVMRKLYDKINIPVPKEIADKGRVNECKDLPTYLDSLRYDDVDKIIKPY